MIMHGTASAAQAWQAGITDQVAFYARSNARARSDSDFAWDSIEFPLVSSFPRQVRFLKYRAFRLGLRRRQPLTVDWLAENGQRLWDARQKFEDELSRRCFDSMLVVRLTDHRQYFMPPEAFDDIVSIESSAPFDGRGLPGDYQGTPLREFALRLDENVFCVPRATVVTRGIQLHLLNRFRQYLLRRPGVDYSPRRGEVVYDCGACIGEMSLLFAAMVGERGAVHLFDPMPLHIRFCELQKQLNPELVAGFHPVAKAVGKVSSRADAGVPDAGAANISPGARSTGAFPFVALDDYARSTDGRIDFLKMDVEGSEIDALKGASGLIRDQKPRLAICVYHRPSDLWEIPELIQRIHPGYVLHFGHHTPTPWESVVYARDPSATRHGGG